MDQLMKFTLDEAGATAVEYALLMAFIAVAIVTSVTTFGQAVNGLFQKRWISGPAVRLDEGLIGVLTWRYNPFPLRPTAVSPCLGLMPATAGDSGSSQAATVWLDEKS